MDRNPLVEEYVDKVTDFMRSIHMFHIEEGRKTYYPTWNLIDMLLMTEIYPTERMIKLPARIVYIGIPNNHPFKNAFWISDEYKNNIKFRWKGLYIAQQETPIPDQCIFQIGLAKEHPSKNMPDISNVILNGGGHMSVTWNIGDTINGVMKSIEDESAMTFDLMSDAETILRFITNFATYLTSSSCIQTTFEDENRYKRLVAEMKKTRDQRKVEKLKKKIEKETIKYGIILGSDIVLDRTCMQKHHLPQNIGHKIGVRHWVAGHWRNQACGHNHEDRKLLWIKPHLRGPSDAPMRYSEHIVKINKR